MFVSSVLRIIPITRRAVIGGTKTYARSIVSIDINQGQFLPSWNASALSSLPSLRIQLAPRPIAEDLESASRFAAARAAAIGSCSYCIIDDH